MEATDTSQLTFANFPFLKKLGLSEENLGCYNNGEWKSNGGGEHTSLNPHNNKGGGQISRAPP